MTPQRRDSLVRFAKTIATIATALLCAWGVADRVGAIKLDVSRFERDSAVIMAHDSAWKDGVSGALRDLKTSVDSANLRLRQIQCGAKVETGCR